MLRHERDFNKAAVRRLSMTDSALRRIDLSPQNPRHLPWPLRITPPDKRSIGNYLRLPVTYTVVSRVLLPAASASKTFPRK